MGEGLGQLKALECEWGKDLEQVQGIPAVCLVLLVKAKAKAKGQ